MDAEYSDKQGLRNSHGFLSRLATFKQKRQCPFRIAGCVRLLVKICILEFLELSIAVTGTVVASTPPLVLWKERLLLIYAWFGCRTVDFSTRC